MALEQITTDDEQDQDLETIAQNARASLKSTLDKKKAALKSLKAPAKIVVKEEEEVTPKGMVRTEMGRLVKKEDQEAWDRGVVKAMNSQYADRLKAKAKLGSMKKGLEKNY